MKFVAFVNQKGGVGKTTACRTLSSMLAKKGKKVLVIDLDPQQTLSISIGAVSGILIGFIYNSIFFSNISLISCALFGSVGFLARL